MKLVGYRRVPYLLNMAFQGNLIFWIAYRVKKTDAVYTQGSPLCDMQSSGFQPGLRQVVSARLI